MCTVTIRAHDQPTVSQKCAIRKLASQIVHQDTLQRVRNAGEKKKEKKTTIPTTGPLLLVKRGHYMQISALPTDANRPRPLPESETQS